MYIQMQLHLSLLSNASVTAGGRARLSSARRRTRSIAARRAEDGRALPAMTDRLHCSILQRHNFVNVFDTKVHLAAGLAKLSRFVACAGVLGPVAQGDGCAIDRRVF